MSENALKLVEDQPQIAPKDPQLEDLKTALGETSEPMVIKGRKIVIREFTAEDLLEVLPLVNKAQISALEVVELVNPRTGEQDQYFQHNVLKLVMGAAPLVFSLLAKVTGEKETWLRGLPMSLLLKLVRTALEVNKAFFDEIELLRSGLNSVGLMETRKAEAPADSPGQQSPQHLDAETLARMNSDE